MLFRPAVAGLRRAQAKERRFALARIGGRRAVGAQLFGTRRRVSLHYSAAGKPLPARASKKGAKCERMGERVKPGNRPMSSEDPPSGVIDK